MMFALGYFGLGKEKPSMGILKVLLKDLLNKRNGYRDSSNVAFKGKSFLLKNLFTQKNYQT